MDGERTFLEFTGFGTKDFLDRSVDDAVVVVDARIVVDIVGLGALFDGAVLAVTQLG